MKTEIVLHEEDASVRGNVLDSGSKDLDRAAEDTILERLGQGDQWAWCCVEVRTTWEGLVESEFLGCCSYEDETNFRNGGYFHDMQTECIARIKTHAACIVRAYPDLFE